ncbi:pleckstrin homology domain-containing family M member 2 isoform X1 [Astyanax mexicanus]|uniref:pleckstrin homology domain-containing family M member 2 isoform X1 n=1 Tax=Astyanax mexicanus TaxID=7994 RepID=UPI0020CAF7A7|nr:pleckstrin homology domain-containing family M member 2 isoform X1 [Astyanax mexicanus]
MDQLKVKDRILENISLSVKKLQSYFAACEDETPAIRNHDRVLQRLCEHLDHALLYGLQDISSGYWVLVLHFTRREAVRQIDELQHIATNLGRSRAWLYLALSESSLESYLRLFQENQALLQKYYFKNALVCSHDHLTLFLTLVSGLEFIRFDLELDVPYLDVAPYMPEYYKPQNLLDFEERLPSSDSLSLHSFTSLTSTNLEWDDSAIAPSSEDYDFGDIFPVLQSMPSADWEEGDLTDPVSGPRSSASDPQTVVSDSVVIRAAPPPVRSTSLSRSPTFRHNPFNEDSDTNTSADVTPVHTATRHDGTTGEDTESASTELEVIRMARRRKPGKKRRGKGSTDSASSGQNVASPEPTETDESLQIVCKTANSEDDPNGGSWSPLDGPEPNGAVRDPAQTSAVGGENEEAEALLRLPQMTDTSMDRVGQPLRDVVDRLNGDLDGNSWENREQDEEEGKDGVTVVNPAADPLQHQSFREDAGGEPPDPDCKVQPLAPSPKFLEAAAPPADFYCFTPHSPGPAAQSGSHHDFTGNGQSQAVSGGHEDEREGEAAAAAKQTASSLHLEGKGSIDAGEVIQQNGSVQSKAEDEADRSSPTENSHPAEFRVDNNHLLLLMIHVFRENEEQLFKMVRMSTGHMEGDLQPLYLLLTDCYMYLLRKGAAEKPYTVEEAVSYSELDYVSVGLDQQTVTLVCTNRRRQFLLDTADCSLTIWFLSVLKSAMINGYREPPYPAVLTDATMEKLALTKFVCQESHCEVSEVSIRLYSLVHWEDPMDASVVSPTSPSGSRISNSTKEGALLYRAGTSYLGKEVWKSCYLVLSNGVLYQYAERTDVTPLMSITMGGEHCGGCRRSNSTERQHAFQVIITARPPLELSAENEQDMADWMQLICQAVSKGVIPQGVAPTPCIPCCLVLTDKKLLTCHQDCQTSFFRSLGGADVSDVTAVCLEEDKEYCVLEFAADRAHFLPPWVLYFSGCGERDRLLEELDTVWTNVFQVCLPRKPVLDVSVQKKCREALELMTSAWQRSDSLHRGRSQREPWC